MGVIGLVHGAWGGAWYWELLRAELEARGHATVAVDLPCDDPAAGLSRYAEVVDEALCDAADVVLVGHSLGGLTIPLVAERRPVAGLVYLCALIPEPGRSLRDELSAGGPFVPGFAESTVRDELGRSSWPDREAATRDLFHDLPRTEAERWLSRLRPQAPAPIREACPLDRLPDVASTYVLCTEDRVVDPDWSRRTARERLGVRPLELAGGHSPMLSRPGALAELLLEAVLA
jgi:pimeloyl-ACP methyl ester carboxylesterase